MSTRTVAPCALLALALGSGCALLPESARARPTRWRSLDVAPHEHLRLPEVAPLASARPPVTGELSLADVLSSVERSHPAIAAALQEREAAAGRRLSAEGAFDLGIKGKAAWMAEGYYDPYEASLGLEQPTTLWGTSFSAGYKLGGGKFPVWEGGRKTNYGGEFRVGVRVPLLRDGPIDRSRGGLRQAEIDQDLAEATIQRQRIELARRATREYWTWIAASERLAIAEALLDLALARARAVAESVAQGDLPAVEGVDNERLIASRRALLAATRRAFEQSAIELSLYVRDAEGLPLPLDRSRAPRAIPEADQDPGELSRLLNVALEARPELRRLALLRERTAVDLDLAKNQQLPGLDLTGVASQDLRGTPYPDKKPFELELGVTLDVPLERRAARGREKAARAAAESLRAEERLAADRIAADVQDALSAVGAATTRIRESRRAAERALALEQAERVSFEQGNSTLLVLNLREQATADARALVVDALADQQRAWADLRAALGVASGAAADER